MVCLVDSVYELKVVDKLISVINWLKLFLGFFNLVILNMVLISGKNY